MLRSILLISALAIAGSSLGCGSSADDSANANLNSQHVDLSQVNDPDAAFTQGVNLLDAGDADRAIEYLNRAVELNSEHAAAYFQLGIAYSLIERRDSTLVEEQVTPGDSETGDAKTRSAQAFEKAVEAYKKQIETNENDHLANFNLGRAYNKLNQDQNAAKALRQAVKLSPEDTDYQTELGSILIKLADYRDAIGPLKKAIELDPENSRAIALLDDAEAGRRRIDFVSNRDDKTASNSNANTNANTGDAPPPPPANARPPETKPTNQAPRSTPAPRPTTRPN